MNVSEVCQQIFDLCLPYAEKTDVPVAYINITINADSPFVEETLLDSFDKIKWDTPLSTAELTVTAIANSKHEQRITLISLTYFEEDGKADAEYFEDAHFTL